MQVQFWLLAILVAVVGAAAVVWALIRSRHMNYWLGDYISRGDGKERTPVPDTIVHVCMADHWEPFGGNVTREHALERVEKWMGTYPKIAAGHRDSFGRVPQHSFFFPLEDYDPGTLDRLAEISRAGFGDVEVHYHHDNDNAEALARSLTEFKNTLFHRHGLLRKEPGQDDVAYCFIHGNWALDNSRPDGRWCGVDDELSVLINTGCRVDYTMPSAPSDTQTRKINSIYFSRGKAGCRKSHDHGRDVGVGKWGARDELLLVQGPLGLNWKSRKLGVVPRIENGEISADAKPTAERVKLWWKLAPRVIGEERHVFIKLHTHGTQDDNMAALLGGDLERMWTLLEQQFRDRPGIRLRYVTAWEMYCSIRAIATGTATAADAPPTAAMAAQKG